MFLFPVLQVFWNPEFSAQLDLDDRQGLIASSAMQQKKKKLASVVLSPVPFLVDVLFSPASSLVGVLLSPCAALAALPLSRLLFWLVCWLCLWGVSIGGSHGMSYADAQGSPFSTQDVRVAEVQFGDVCNSKQVYHSSSDWAHHFSRAADEAWMDFFTRRRCFDAGERRT